MSLEVVDEWDSPATLTCDGCGAFLEFSSFKRVLVFKMKEKEKYGGWRSAKVDGEWKDFCGDCTKKFALSGRG
jgi:hypothetical protein